MTINWYRPEYIAYNIYVYRFIYRNEGTLRIARANRSKEKHIFVFFIIIEMRFIFYNFISMKIEKLIL